jgi:Uma2 family endonuclease
VAAGNVTGMTAQPIDHEPPHWQPDPVRQRLANHTLEDVLALPEDAPRVELVDGVMLVVPSTAIDHQDIASLLWAWFRANAPRHLRPVQAVGVAVAANTTYEPDVLLYLAEGGETNRHFLNAHEVVLAVEVVSPNTRRRDRFHKPANYAEAGIPFYWRVEQNPVHVYAYRAANGVYTEQADSAEELVVDGPFGIRLPISEITP